MERPLRGRARLRVLSAVVPGLRARHCATRKSPNGSGKSRFDHECHYTRKPRSPSVGNGQPCQNRLATRTARRSRASRQSLDYTPGRTNDDIKPNDIEPSSSSDEQTKNIL
ncbi:hypothetical protein C8R46DRAFT_1062190 [Mycena filopes]|nr:hypothetical protein C8R46DRAFT_1062190 [Mycena filopes]